MVFLMKNYFILAIRQFPVPKSSNFEYSMINLKFN